MENDNWWMEGRGKMQSEMSLGSTLRLDMTLIKVKNWTPGMG